MGQTYLTMEDGPGLMRQQNVAKRGGFETKLNVFKMCVKLSRCGEETDVTERITD